ncbi:Arv1-like protein [Toxoplasma gondii FOU]|uniref:Arv1-like protein n=1 Tax=Toxoplasma gondii FOU TaxID=943167 RepID=A0A086LFL1_TOXGO|nr:Arv1-like protein [Toxoplasma gondii FOU]
MRRPASRPRFGTSPSSAFSSTPTRAGFFCMRVWREPTSSTRKNALPLGATTSLPTVMSEPSLLARARDPQLVIHRGLWLQRRRHQTERTRMVRTVSAAVPTREVGRVCLSSRPTRRFFAKRRVTGIRGATLSATPPRTRSVRRTSGPRRGTRLPTTFGRTRRSLNSQTFLSSTTKRRAASQWDAGGFAGGAAARSKTRPSLRWTRSRSARPRISGAGRAAEEDARSGVRLSTSA